MGQLVCPRCRRGILLYQTTVDLEQNAVLADGEVIDSEICRMSEWRCSACGNEIVHASDPMSGLAIAPKQRAEDLR